MKRYRSQQEHRAIMEKSLGRKLKPEEIVHHINGDSLDNRVENLVVVTRKAHQKIHGLDNAAARAKKRTIPIKGDVLQFRLPEEMGKRVRQLAALHLRTFQDEIRWLITVGLQTEEVRPGVPDGMTKEGAA